MNKINRINELVNILNMARFAYEQEDQEIMSNYEYDKLYDELEQLEKETSIILSNSPTQNVGYEVVSNLPKVKHLSKILSLEKTKDIKTLKSFVGNEEALLSWKLDGLTIVCNYENGKLVRGTTRGNGEVGEDVTNNVMNFANIPLTIPYKEPLTVRGEALIYYDDFNKINEKLPNDRKYKNPRNLASGSVRQLDPNVTKERKVKILIFAVIDGMDDIDNKYDQFEKLKEFGFEVVDQKKVNKNNIEETVKWFSENIDKQQFASDGLVLTFNNIELCNKLGIKTKTPKYALAFKWKDETQLTTLRSIEWNTSRTGLINPIAIFDEIELEGTTVERASIHNLSILEELKLGIGDEIEVYKANMIIPQILKNNTMSGTCKCPTHCPSCGHKTRISMDHETKTVICDNEDCPAQKVMKICNFVGKEQMNIVGFSEATIEKFLDLGIITDFPSIYKIEQFKDVILKTEGFKDKSYKNLINAINNSKKVKLPNFIFALGISNIGYKNAKNLCEYFNNDLEKIMNATKEELLNINGVGNIMAASIINYFSNKNHIEMIKELLEYIEFIEEEKIEIKESNITGKSFLVTGNVEYFKNRKEVENKIVEMGGIIAKSVNKDLDYLINNDINSTSSKNKKAKELIEKGEKVKIITENDFMEMIK